MTVYRTVADGIADLYAHLATDPSQRSSTPVAALTKVTQVFNHEPRPEDAPKPIVVTLAPLGMDATEFQIAIRVYSSVETDPLAAIADLGTTCDQIISILPPEVGPERWTITYDNAIDCHIAEQQLDVPRDFWS